MWWKCGLNSNSSRWPVVTWTFSEQLPFILFYYCLHFKSLKHPNELTRDLYFCLLQKCWQHLINYTVYPPGKEAQEKFNSKYIILGLHLYRKDPFILSMSVNIGSSSNLHSVCVFLLGVWTKKKIWTASHSTEYFFDFLCHMRQIIYLDVL